MSWGKVGVGPFVDRTGNVKGKRVSSRSKKVSVMGKGGAGVEGNRGEKGESCRSSKEKRQRLY